MTGDKSRLLKPFDRVCWQNDQADQGTVIEKNWSGVTIKWDSRGEQAIFTTTWPELSVCRRNWCEVAGGIMAKIITKSNTDELAGWITEFLARSSSNLIRIEGVCGSGKTTIAQKLQARGVGLHINADQFAARPAVATPYPGCVKQNEFDAAIADAIKTDNTVILDAVCLEEVAPVQRWGRGLRIYVKRLSFNNVDPSWHAGFNLEDETPINELDRSVHLYHLKYQPHMHADLIVEFPEDFHQLPNVRFSRERCFDPPNSIVVL